MPGLIFRNKFEFSCFKDGLLKWKEIIYNIVVDEALNYNLGLQFKGYSTYSDWYILLFNSDDTPVAGWTYANIGTDFTEFEDYDETTRVLWDSSAISGKSLNNTATPSEFTASTSVNTTIYGAAMVNTLTKGDNSNPNGLIWCGTRFGTPRPFLETEVIQVVYTVNVTDV